MGNIKAFVGHSFTSDDEQVVARFLKMFDQIKVAMPNFDWTNAKQAEPEELSSKVLKLVADCNTFIAICTKKELVSPPEAIKKSFLKANSSIIRDDRLNWKTSDWIIQEIGLAFGRKMSLIILLEDGCRRPGGLQGNVEFISFERQAPEKAFGQILEMLRAISPPIGSQTEGAIDTASGVAHEPEHKSDLNTEDDAPKSGWTVDDFERAFFWKLIRGETEAAEAISEAFHASELAVSDEARAEWDSRCELRRLQWTEKGDLRTLRELHGKYTENIKVKTMYALALGKYSKHKESAELFEEASSIGTILSDKVENKIEAAIQRSKGGQSQLALQHFNEVKGLVKNDPDLAYLLARGISRFAEAEKNDTLRIEAMEQMIWLRPDDDDTRFSLAFAHSEASNNDMALHHYLAIPHARRKEGTWNNIGVAYQHFSIPARSIDAFRHAASEGNTLAMSNLAYRYLNVGFLKEAKEQLDNALNTEEPHKNVSEALSSVMETPDKEKKEVDEILASASKKIAAFEKLGQAILEPDIITLNAEWICPDCELTVAIKDSKFEASGRYQEKMNALTGLLATVKHKEYEIAFTGEIAGRRVFGDVVRTPVGTNATSILAGALNRESKRFAILFDSTLQSGEVIEAIDSREPRFYQIHAKPRQPRLEVNVDTPR
ncbi:tetratricopeptide repeat protein [Sphingorhabdus lacus]|uniref:Uncharacterized protein n=1 Tax=Sphingorhabdus lacus TaxID=392610 RepID=A0A6I6LAF9_9SPHN|nr:hypothetical protein [Sphingorhabdus lacus]QGY79492.1 hypothetical protein EUU25_01945 [Sphingorhabdus lacus]